MRTTRIAVVEDQLLVAEDIVARLERKGFETVGPFDNGEDAYRMCDEEYPDIILMDIELAGEWDGIETAKKINKNFNIPIIFITDFNDSEKFQEALSTMPSHYITKPFHINDLERAIHIAMKQQDVAKKKLIAEAPDPEFMFIKGKEGLKYKVVINDILYVEAYGSSSNIFYLKDGIVEKFTSNENSTTVGELLPNQFQRVHKSYIVNTKQVDTINGRRLWILGTEIKIGDKFKDVIDSFVVLK